MTILCIILLVVAVFTILAMLRMDTGDLASMLFVALLTLSVATPISYLLGLRS